MSRIKKLMRYWFVERGKVSLAAERIKFVQDCLVEQVAPTATLSIYRFGSITGTAELVAYLPETQNLQISEQAFLMTYGAVDQIGNKYFFFEHWFADWSFNRSRLYAVSEWPPFKRYFIDIATMEDWQRLLCAPVQQNPEQCSVKPQSQPVVLCRDKAGKRQLRVLK